MRDRIARRAGVVLCAYACGMREPIPRLTGVLVCTISDVVSQRGSARNPTPSVRLELGNALGPMASARRYWRMKASRKGKPIASRGSRRSGRAAEDIELQAGPEHTKGG